ncbi:baculoviral IAP repeat-containing protein 5a [Fundulus heteroclitus]|uniref:Baculoviral IAP repeat containing 5a n=1 Tax=Fundulus heteroclitus TaxID=8078 RepID=A0A146ZSI9_FUNHE|nr:baculoviral IAP repeat-containing protein 5a [Fundulus heteroclitus]
MENLVEEDVKFYIFENRLKTFDGWPFDKDCACTPENMAKAGFVHTPTENSPDVAMCFLCLKELEGWEPDDDPQQEHKIHSPSCNFIALKKKVEELTVEEFFKLQRERHKRIVSKMANEAVARFSEAAKQRRVELLKIDLQEE